ncbi:LysR family transcriptional regulator [Aeromicrobium sp.]|uniref:LysR family transcriptional regulator n=1 Tax=Aeromicrobium sp. TaxID=1871063 RepID=UPI003D6BAEDB
MELELRHLRVVCAVADAGSVTKAAASLGLAQPALTAQLHRIERVLGGPLFERDHRGVRPTPMGELVITRARLLLPAMTGLRDEAARLSSNAGRDALGAPEHLRVGSSTSAVLGRLIHHLTAAHADLQVTTHVSWSAQDLAGMLTDGRLDFAVVGVCGDGPPPPRAGLEWHTIAIDPVFILVPEDHPLVSKDVVDLAELSSAQWVATTGDGCFGDCFATACARAGFTPRNVYETDVASCVDLVESGGAIALCQATRVLPGLVTVPITGTPLRWRHLIGWHPESPVAAFSDAFAQSAVDAYRDLIDRSARYSAWLEEHPSFGVQPTPRITPTV